MYTFSQSENVKKMYSHLTITYTLPRLHEGKCWYVDFVSFDPVEGKMKRKKYMLNRLKNMKERRQYATDLITNLSFKLRNGWSPWIEEDKTSRQMVRYKDVISMYHIYLSRLHKSSAIKHNTYLDYTKRAKILLEYNDKHPSPIVFAYQFDQSYICDFLDYILIDRDSSARTRNNYRTWLSSLCNWMIERSYILSNPIEKIKMLAESDKRRDPITPNDLNKLRKYLTKENPHFLLLCSFAYYTFIRPDEITNIRLCDINLKEQKVYVASTISKNRRDGMVGLNDRLIKEMIKLRTFDAPSEYYLFGKGFKPGKNKSSTKIFRTYFYKVREVLHFPTSYQFYSLKDSGIRDLANSKGIVVARDQARHADVSTTNKYLKGHSLAVHEETKHFKGIL